MSDMQKIFHKNIKESISAGRLEAYCRDGADECTTLDRFTPIYDAGIQPWKEKIRSHWPKAEER